MIPIKNIYYMLCYVWDNTLKQEGEALLDNEAFENIYNLLASILIRAVKKIIKSTLEDLLKCPSLENKYKWQIKILLRNFIQIFKVNLSNVGWGRIRHNRNNRNYRLSLNICELINTGLITKEEKGLTKFATYIKDNAIARLYEKFVLNFYKYELKGYKVSSPWIS